MFAEHASLSQPLFDPIDLVISEDLALVEKSALDDELATEPGQLFCSTDPHEFVHVHHRAVARVVQQTGNARIHTLLYEELTVLFGRNTIFVAQISVLESLRCSVFEFFLSNALPQIDELFASPFEEIISRAKNNQLCESLLNFEPDASILFLLLPIVPDDVPSVQLEILHLVVKLILKLLASLLLESQYLSLLSNVHVPLGLQLVEVPHSRHMLPYVTVFVEGLGLVLLLPVLHDKVVFEFGLIRIVLLHMLASVVLNLEIWEGGCKKYGAASY